MIGSWQGRSAQLTKNKSSIHIGCCVVEGRLARTRLDDFLEISTSHLGHVYAILSSLRGLYTR